MSITDDEFTVLMIAAKGEYMLPIGRWKPSIEALTQKGLMIGQHLNGGMQYTITRAGKAAIGDREKEEDQQIKQMIERSGTITAVRNLVEQAAQKLVQAARDSAQITGHTPQQALEDWARPMLAKARELLDG